MPAKTKHHNYFNGVQRTLHKARDSLWEFAFTVAGCGAVVGVLMIVHALPLH